VNVDGEHYIGGSSVKDDLIANIYYSIATNDAGILETVGSAGALAPLPITKTYDLYGTGEGRMHYAETINNVSTGYNVNFDAKTNPITYTMAACVYGNPDNPAFQTLPFRWNPSTVFVGDTKIRQDVIRLKQAASVAIDAAPFSTWSGLNGTATFPSAGASALFVTTSLPSTFVYDFPSPVIIGYRNYTLRVRSVGSDNVPIRVQYGGKLSTGPLDPGSPFQRWDVETGLDGVWTDIPLDLLDGTVDWWRGVNADTAQIMITVPPNSTIEYQGFTAVRLDETLLSVLRPASTIGTAAPTFNKSVHAFTDGMPSLNTNGTTNIASIPATATALNKAGWSGSILVAAGLNDFAGSQYDVTYLENRAGKIDEDASVFVNLASEPFFYQFYGYPGCGDIFARLSGAVGSTGGYDVNTSATWRCLQGAQVTGTLSESGATLKVNKKVGGADEGTGVSDASGFATTKTPFIRIPGYDSAPTVHQVSTKGGLSKKTQFAAGQTITEFSTMDSNDWRLRLWTRWFLRSLPTGVIAIDSARQLIYAASDTKIASWHLPTFTQQKASVSHPVERWECLCYEPRRSTLWAIGKVASLEQRKVYRSGDGGGHIAEVLSVDAKSAQLTRDSERQFLILIYQDATDDTLKRKLSKDVGATWSSAEGLIVDGATGITGAVVDMAQDPRALGAVILTRKDLTTDAVTLLRSYDSGLHWATVLS
jgi:hypothetical protein